jgi:DNA-binding NarL/FixJ family response regulator
MSTTSFAPLSTLAATSRCLYRSAAIARILLADEFTLVREGLASLCGAFSGFEVVCQVGSGIAAVEAILRLEPDIALIDGALSDLAVCEVIRRVRQGGSKTKCALISGKRDRKTVLEALRCGACGYLLKDSSAAQLAEALNQLMQGGIYVSPQIEVMTLFTEGAGRVSPKNPLDHLSSREFQVFSLLVDGIRAKEIAARLALSPKTVDTYRSSLMRKLEIYDVAGLVKFAIHQQIA